MAKAIPFAGREYRPDRRALSELMYRRGMSAADAERAKGDRSAQMALTIGDTVSRGLSTWANYKSGEQERNYRKTEIAARERELGKKQQLDELGKMAAGQPITERIKIYEQAGQQEAADSMRARYEQGVQNSLARIGQQQTAIGRAASLTREMALAPDKSAFRPTLVDLAGQLGNQDLAKMVSTMPLDDTTMPQIEAFVSQAALATDALAKARAFDKQMLDKQTANITSEKNMAEVLKLRAPLFTLSKTEQEHEAVFNSVHGELSETYGTKFADKTLAQFEDWTDDLPQRAKRLGMTDAERTAAAKVPEPYTLSPGSVRFGPDGQRIASVPSEPRNPPPSDPLESVVGPDGKAIFVRRSEAAGMRPGSTREQASTGVQKRALGFFNRAKQADEELEALEADVQKLGIAGQLRQEWAPNFAQSQTGQSYLQAQRAFTEARLRKDSGAAIPDNEFDSDRKTYFAQPGDSQVTLEQKRRARANMLASLAVESGHAFSEMFGDDAPTLLQEYRVRSTRPSLTGRPPLNVGAPPAAQPPASAVPAGSVLMEAPNGQRSYVPAAQVEQAKARGAKVIG